MNAPLDLDTRNPPSHFLDLTAGTVLRLRHAAGTRISVWSGCVWITQEGDARDIVVTAGRHFLLDRHGLAVVQVLEAGELRVDPAQGRSIGGVPLVKSWRTGSRPRIRIMPALAVSN